MKVCDCCKAENVCEFTLPILMKNELGGNPLMGAVKIELCRTCAAEVSLAYFEIVRKHENEKINGTYLGGFSESDAAYEGREHDSEGKKASR